MGAIAPNKKLFNERKCVNGLMLLLNPIAEASNPRPDRLYFAARGKVK